ncbi:hypothetical protein KDAU_23560 [Dictyobacter aurantiacus]|uniref:Uncharacterized protein n=1 Tax=Dictyobacter aurantiacus TaxID=1936993 RepID=A0A401ZDS3_9CHLR|nr:hypothetical protein KDAU_23560 [Dictyobacter aurantiacus]
MKLLQTQSMGIRSTFYKPYGFTGPAAIVFAIMPGAQKSYIRQDLLQPFGSFTMLKHCVTLRVRFQA